jgi:hypothetical protein
MNKTLKPAAVFILAFMTATTAAAESGAARQRELDSLYAQAMWMTGRPSPGESARTAARRPIKCGFSLKNQVRVRFSQFSPEQRILLSKMMTRPELPYSVTSSSDRFRIHYALNGPDAVSGEDADRNGVPDYIDTAASSLEYAYHVEVEELGFKPPPADDTDGPEWDIYIENIDNSYGSTMPDKLIGFNPDVYTSYIELDNDYRSTDTHGLDGLRITIAHEFFHMIQLGWNARAEGGRDFTDLFLWEAAPWMRRHL